MPEFESLLLPLDGRAAGDRFQQARSALLDELLVVITETGVGWVPPGVVDELARSVEQCRHAEQTAVAEFGLDPWWPYQRILDDLHDQSGLGGHDGLGPGGWS